jgi:hypothetical protein
MPTSTQYPKWVHDPSGLHASVVADDEEHEKRILKEWNAPPVKVQTKEKNDA